ncbi:MAG: NUDIX domain-containing protein, partial [Ardenticatenaceae bacterium]
DMDLTPAKQMKQTYYETGGGVVLNEHGGVLLLERYVPREEGLRHEIRFPKEHIDPGESAEIAALREVREESGYVELEVLAPLGNNRVEYEHRGERVTRTEHYFLMRLRRDHRKYPHADPRSEEALYTVRWAADFDDAAEQLTYDGEKLFARRAARAWEQLHEAI